MRFVPPAIGYYSVVPDIIDRIEAIKIIFESYIAGAGARKIIRSLNSGGYRLPGGRIFYISFIYNVIGNGHIYSGRVAYFKSNIRKFYHE